MSGGLVSPYKGIFFDLDGTLADTAPDLVAAANQLLIARNLPPMQYEVLRPRASAGARGLIRGAFGIDTDHPDFIPLRESSWCYRVRIIDVDQRPRAWLQKYFKQDLDIVSEFLASGCTRVCVE